MFRQAALSANTPSSLKQTFAHASLAAFNLFNHLDRKKQWRWGGKPDSCAPARAHHTTQAYAKAMKRLKVVKQQTTRFQRVTMWAMYGPIGCAVKANTVRRWRDSTAVLNGMMTKLDAEQFMVQVWAEDFMPIVEAAARVTMTILTTSSLFVSCLFGFKLNASDRVFASSASTCHCAHPTNFAKTRKNQRFNINGRIILTWRIPAPTNVLQIPAKSGVRKGRSPSPLRQGVISRDSYLCRNSWRPRTHRAPHDPSEHHTTNLTRGQLTKRNENNWTNRQLIQHVIKFSK